MNDEPKALVDMTPEEAAPIMEAWRTNQPVEYFGYFSEKWTLDDSDKLSLRARYRIASRPLTVSPKLWAVLHPDVVAIARDRNGELRRHTFDVIGLVCMWTSEGCATIDPDAYDGLIDIGTCDWTKAIAYRPGCEPE